jgi:hypothetical protein
MADMIPQGTQDYAVEHGHERADVNVRHTLLSAVVVMSAVLVSILAMAGMFRYLLQRETVKDKMTPALYSYAQRPAGPPLLPSIQRDELPWVAYQNERREMETEAAKVGIIDLKSGAYKVPNVAKDGQSQQYQYFRNKTRWEGITEKYSSDSSGGRKIETYAPDGLRRLPGTDGLMPGVTMTSPEPPVRNGQVIKLDNGGASH